MRPASAASQPLPQPGTAPSLQEKWRAGDNHDRVANLQFTHEQWTLVLACLHELWSPEQISGRLAVLDLLSISHETIYRYVWNDRWHGGSLHTYLRHDPKQLRKRYGRYDSRGRLAGKCPISQRPPGAENRSRMGHLEGDTMIGTFDKH